MLNKLGIKRSFLFFVLFICSVTTIIGLSTYIKTRLSLNNVEAVALEATEFSGKKSNLLKLYSSLHSNVIAALGEKEDENRMLRLEIISGYEAEMNKLLNTCAATDCKELKAKSDEYSSIWSEIKNKYVEKNNLSGGLDVAITKLVPAAEGLFDYLDKDLSDGLKKSDARTKAQLEYTSLTQNILFVFTLLNSVVVLFTGLYFRKSLVAFLESNSQNLRASAEAAAEISSNLASLSYELTDASKKQSTCVESTTSSLNQLIKINSINVQSVTVASEVSTTSEKNATDGSEKIKTLIESMHNISKTSAKVSSVLTVVDDIAYQTNLLALNAAVEAAKAGEYGRSFSVVADAVKSLSHKSIKAAKEINQLIDKSNHEITGSLSLCSDSNTALGEILNSVIEIKQINNEISTSSQQEYQGIQNLSQSIKVIDDVNKVNASISGSISDTSSIMLEQAEKLKTQVYNLDHLLSGDPKINFGNIRRFKLPFKRGKTSKKVESEKSA